MNLIADYLKQQPKESAHLMQIYRYVQKNYSYPSLSEIKIKYCLLILHIKHKVSISNRIKNKKYLTPWKTTIKWLDVPKQIEERGGIL